MQNKWDSDEIIQKPNKKVLSNTDHAKRVKLWQIAVVASVISGVFGTPLAVMSFVTSNFLHSDVEQNISELNPYGKAEATLALENYLKDFNDKIIMSWDGATYVSYISPDDNQTDIRSGIATINGTVYSHTFTIKDVKTNKFYRTNIRTITSQELGTKTFGKLGLIPYNAPAIGAWGLDMPLWANLESVSVPNHIKQNTEQWVKVYFSDDVQALKVLVGDTRTDYIYQPYGFETVRELTVNQGAYLDESQNEMLVNITIALPKPNAKIVAENIMLSFDLLIYDAQSGMPHIVAWDVAGNGQTLTGYQNAVSIEREQEN
jgi:hypothetical protein